MKKFIKRILRERREQVNKARGKRKAFVPCGVMDFRPDFSNLYMRYAGPSRKAARQETAAFSRIMHIGG